MNKVFISSVICFFVSNIIMAQNNVIRSGDQYYLADRIIVKFTSNQPRLESNLSVIEINKLGLKNIVQKFNVQLNNKESEISKIQTLKFNSPYDPLYVIKEISKLKEVEWAEPHFLYELALEPNDSLYIDGTLQHLSLIQAEEAWDINSGDEEVVIAIVDTGIDYEHPDLQQNIWTNSNEVPDNGIDDDGNGFVDDYYGWDFGGWDGTPDNDPKEDRADHGTLVAGLASAVTNNGIGVASIGYKSKLMSVKTSQNDVRTDLGIALIGYGYEGILYAVDNGADIINCSWGGFNYSFLAQEVIDYATANGALIVGAAGNSNSANLFYPASYNGVLSVGGTSYVDQKASWSNYGTKIDVTAPGVNVTSTWQTDPFYHATSGTSLSSPIVAGLAALTKSQFPNFNPLQIAEQIRTNSDNINDINPNYVDMLGAGRINAFQTLSNANSKSVRVSNIEFLEVGDGDGVFESGEIVKIIPEFTNYLGAISNLNVSILLDDINATVTQIGGTIGSFNTLETKNSFQNLFEIEISETAEENTDLNIMVSYSDIGYSDFEWIVLNINPTYQIQTTENLSITFNSTGSIGFDDYPTNLKGNGLIYKNGTNLMFEGALMYGTSSKTITNVARAADANSKDQDFNIVTPIFLSSPGEFGDKEITAQFDDSFAQNSLGIETKLRTYSFSDDVNADYMFIRYEFTNKTNDTIRNFYTGQFWDFDLDGSSYDDDMVAYDYDYNFGYVYDDDDSPIGTHIGLALLSSDKYGFMALDSEGTNASVISWDGFSDEEKWTSLSSGLNYTNAGPSDVSVVISGGPFLIEPNSSLGVDYVIALGDDKNLTKLNMLRAKNKYFDLPTSITDNKLIKNRFNLEQNYPNPFNPSTTIRYEIPEQSSENTYDVKLIVYDVLGKKVSILVNKIQGPGQYKVQWNGLDTSSGVYFIKLTAGNYSKTKKMMLIR